MEVPEPLCPREVSTAEGWTVDPVSLERLNIRVRGASVFGGGVRGLARFLGGRGTTAVRPPRQFELRNSSSAVRGSRLLCVGVMRLGADGVLGDDLARMSD